MKKIIITLIVFLSFIGKSHASDKTIEIFEHCERVMIYNEKRQEMKSPYSVEEAEFLLSVGKCAGFLSWFPFIQMIENCRGTTNLDATRVEVFMNFVKKNPSFKDKPATLTLHFAILDYFGCESRISPIILAD